MSEFTEAKSLRYASRRFEQMLDEIEARQLCGHCIAIVLLHRGACLLEVTEGSAAVAEMLEKIAATLRERNRPASEHDVLH
jgi:hypothetical protein